MYGMCFVFILKENIYFFFLKKMVFRVVLGFVIKGNIRCK